MLKKNIIYLLSFLILQLFLSQTIAVLIFNINHSKEAITSYHFADSGKSNLEEFNISTHANLLSVNKDENNKEESNLDILSTFVYNLLCGLCYSEYPQNISFSIPHFKFNTLLQPVYIKNKVFRL